MVFSVQFQLSSHFLAQTSSLQISSLLPFEVWSYTLHFSSNILGVSSFFLWANVSLETNYVRASRITEFQNFSDFILEFFIQAHNETFNINNFALIFCQYFGLITPVNFAQPRIDFKLFYYGILTPSRESWRSHT